MKLIIENWRQFVNEEEQEEKSNVLDLGKELNSGFCQFNPLINRYAQYSPENLAEMLIFVVATQRMRWYDVVPKFPLLMQYVKQNDYLLTIDKSELRPIPDKEDIEIDGKKKKIIATDSQGNIIYKKNKDGSLKMKRHYYIPKEFSQLALGARKDSIQEIWDTREQKFATMKPLFDKFNNAAEGSIAKEEAIFEIYLEFIKVKQLGLPKAAFACQLIIGRLGCIDSINMNIYKGLDPEGKLIKYNKEGIPGFKTPGTGRKGKIITVTPGGIKLAEGYVAFLKEIAKLTNTSEAKMSQQLWDSWVELVALKMNKEGDILVKMPGGKEFNVPNDYSKKIKRGDVSPTAKFKKDYIGKITGQDISRQHYPPKMYESIQKWSNYFYGVLSE
jgi:hypothetical protein